MSGLTFSWIDYTMMGILVVSIVISIIRGFVKEALSLATWIIAFMLAYHFAGELAPAFTNTIASPTGRLALSFAIIFFVVLIFGVTINYLVSRLVAKTGLSGTDRALGAVFGGVRGVLMVVVLIFFVSLTPLPQEKAWKDSMLLPTFESIAAWVQEIMPDSIKNFTLPDIPELHERVRDKIEMHRNVDSEPRIENEKSTEHAQTDKKGAQDDQKQKLKLNIKYKPST